MLENTSGNETTRVPEESGKPQKKEERKKERKREREREREK